MKTWTKRLLLFVAIAMVVVLGALLTGLWMIRAEPAFYPRVALNAEQLEAAAQRATNKLVTIQNQAAQLHATEQAGPRQAEDPSTRPADSITISLTADELNAFLEKWSNSQNWKAGYQRYIEDPVVILQDGRIILAARVKDLNLVASLHFEPRIDEQGRLDLQLVRVLGGRLPLPEALIGQYQDQLTSSLRQRLPAWRARAAIDSSGAANPSAVSASAAQLLFSVLSHQPAEPVLYLPSMAQEGSVPVRITDVRIEGETLTLGVKPMNGIQQQALLERIRSNAGPSGAEVNPNAKR